MVNQTPEKLDHEDYVNLVTSTRPNTSNCVTLTKEGLMEWTGNQWNPCWDWKRPTLQNLSDEKLIELYRLYKEKTETEMVKIADEEIPELTGKDMNTLVYLLLTKVGTIEIPQEVLESAPGPEKLQIERQYDGMNKVWRFFIHRKVAQKTKLFLPRKQIIN